MTIKQKVKSFLYSWKEDKTTRCFWNCQRNTFQRELIEQRNYVQQRKQKLGYLRTTKILSELHLADEKKTWLIENWNWSWWLHDRFHDFMTWRTSCHSRFPGPIRHSTVELFWVVGSDASDCINPVNSLNCWLKAARCAFIGDSACSFISGVNSAACSQPSSRSSTKSLLSRLSLGTSPMVRRRSNLRRVLKGFLVARWNVKVRIIN